MLSALANYQDIYKSLAAIKIFACGLLVYGIARESRPSISSMSLWGAVVGVLLLYTFQSIRFSTFQGVGGIKGGVEIPLGASNYVASILLLVLPMSVAGIATYHGVKRLFFAGSCALMLAGVIVTMSRGAMMALILAPTVSLPLLYRAGMRLRHVVLVLVLGSMTIAALPSDLLRVNAALIAYRWVNPDLSRRELLQASWRSFVDNPVLGVGPGQLGRAIAHRVSVPDNNWQYVNAHNLVLNSLAENGCFGGAALLLMIGIVLWTAFRNAAAHPTALNLALFVALVAAIMHNMVEASFEGQQFQVVFWTVAGMIGNGDLPESEFRWRSHLLATAQPRSSGTAII
jgi:O-antigen ligase